MFEWKVEDQVLLNQKGGVFYGREKIYDCESKVSTEDKIDFINRMNDNKLSYFFNIKKIFDQDFKDGKIKKNKEGWIKTVSLRAWLKKNDSKKIIDSYYHYGSIRFLREEWKLQYDWPDNLVQKLFHNQLKECEQEEEEYFEAHDEKSIERNKLRENINKYKEFFGLSISIGSEIKISNRELTKDEIKLLNSKYNELQEKIDQISEELAKEF